MDASSISSHHYAALLQTITDLRADLEKTTARIRSLEDQNETLAESYNTVKEELLETRKKYNEAREGYLNSVTEKFESERQHEIFMEKLKMQLLERTREFEQIKEKLVPHDIDQLRIQVRFFLLTFFCFIVFMFICCLCDVLFVVCRCKKSCNCNINRN